jgi:hypothetical protein
LQGLGVSQNLTKYVKIPMPESLSNNLGVIQNLTEFAKILMPESLKTYVIFFFKFLFLKK